MTKHVAWIEETDSATALTKGHARSDRTVARVSVKMAYIAMVVEATGMEPHEAQEAVSQDILRGEIAIRSIELA